MAVTKHDVCEYVGLEAEYLDPVQERRVEQALAASRLWLRGAVGSDVDMDNPMAEELVLMAAGEMFENRSLTDDRLSKYAGSKAAAALNRLAHDAIMQLKYCDFTDPAEGGAVE